MTGSFFQNWPKGSRRRRQEPLMSTKAANLSIFFFESSENHSAWNIIWRPMAIFLFLFSRSHAIKLLLFYSRCTLAHRIAHECTQFTALHIASSTLCITSLLFWFARKLQKYLGALQRNIWNWVIWKASKGKLGIFLKDWVSGLQHDKFVTQYGGGDTSNSMKRMVGISLCADNKSLWGY